MFKHHLIKHSLASAVVIAAVGCPSAAEAMVIGGGGGVPAPIGTASSVQQRLNQLQSNVRQRFAAEGGWHLSGSPPPRRPPRKGSSGATRASAPLVLSCCSARARSARV